MKNISEAEELDESSENDQHKEKFSAFANRDNSDFKWQRARNVLGVLEIASEPILKPRDEMKPRHNKLRETVFKEALAAWEKEKLRNELVIALETLPVETCCCGLFRDHEETKKELVKLLNEKWTKIANKKLAQHGFKIDFFLWNWQNASGKAETNILLVRFFLLASYGLRAASRSGSMGMGFEFSEELEESFRTS